MARTTQNREPEAGNYFRFKLPGLILFSVCLMAGASLVTAWFHKGRPQAYTDPDQPSAQRPTHSGPWGEMLTREINLERPAELLSPEVAAPHAEAWVFSCQDAAQVKALFLTNGLSPEQADKALEPSRVQVQGNNVRFLPGEDFLLSLAPAARTQLYGALYGKGVNLYLDFPYIFRRGSLESAYADARLHPEDVALLKQLVYPAGEAMRFSDYELLLNRIPTKARRMAMAQVLSRQSAVLVRLYIRPDSDIDQLVNYWGHVPTVRSEDIRPLMQSLKAMPDGGTLSLLYLLPPFARERLYTFPLVQENSAVRMDCHWTTFNFSKGQPDNRFNDPNFALHCIQTNYCEIAAPSVYGDVIMLLNSKSQFVHSAVYLADDLVFTKYGSNSLQPWLITHLKDMMEEYPGLKPVYFRPKTDQHLSEGRTVRPGPPRGV
jgi:hypothetical protein